MGIADKVTSLAAPKAPETPTLWRYVTGAVDGRLTTAGEGIRAVVGRWQQLFRQSPVDFAAEGMLEGADDREARADLLRQLHAAGVPLEDLRRAVEQDRLALLPVEAVLQAEGEHTLEEMAAEADLDSGVLARRVSALGIGRPDERSVFNDHALDAARALKQLQDSGLPDQGIDEICRIAGRCIGSTAEAIREVFGDAFLQSGDTERDLGLRYAGAARSMLPVFEPLLKFALTMHLLQLIRSDVVSRTERATGNLPGSREVAVCFADLANFTRLGERLSPEDLGRLVRRFEGLVQQKTPAAARHVKTIGDAAMLVSSEPEAVLEAAVELIAATNAMDDGFPRIHAGVAMGHAVARDGDWHGRPVNLASRLAACAPTGEIYAADDVRKATGDRFGWSDAGTRRLEGIENAVQVFCLAPSETSGP